MERAEVCIFKFRYGVVAAMIAHLSFVPVAAGTGAGGYAEGDIFTVIRFVFLHMLPPFLFVPHGDWRGWLPSCS